jgi:hypothetical protein
VRGRFNKRKKKGIIYNYPSVYYPKLNKTKMERSLNKYCNFFYKAYFLLLALDIATATPIMIPRITKMMVAIINFI